MQRNEGAWEFTLDISDDSTCVELAVSIGKHLDSTLVQVGACVIVSSTHQLHRAHVKHNARTLCRLMSDPDGHDC